jgi:pimeloyl-ACP methyl ester carboxylesterase
MDPKTPYAGAKAHIALLAKSGSITLHTVEGGPHFVLFTEPADFVAAVRAFVLAR